MIAGEKRILKMHRALNQVESRLILDELENRICRRIGREVQFNRSVGSMSIQSISHKASYESFIDYDDALELADSSSYIDADGELMIDITEKVKFMGVTFTASFRCYSKTPKDDLNTLRLLGKVKWVTPDNRPYESYTCG